MLAERESEDTHRGELRLGEIALDAGATADEVADGETGEVHASPAHAISEAKILLVLTIEGTGAEATVKADAEVIEAVESAGGPLTRSSRSSHLASVCFVEVLAFSAGVRAGCVRSPASQMLKTSFPPRSQLTALTAHERHTLYQVRGSYTRSGTR